MNWKRLTGFLIGWSGGIVTAGVIEEEWQWLSWAITMIIYAVAMIVMDMAHPESDGT